MASKQTGNVPVLIRVPRTVLTKLDASAKRLSRSRSSVVVEALRTHVASAGKVVKS